MGTGMVGGGVVGKGVDGVGGGPDDADPRNLPHAHVRPPIRTSGNLGRQLAGLKSRGRTRQVKREWRKEREDAGLDTHAAATVSETVEISEHDYNPDTVTVPVTEEEAEVAASRENRESRGARVWTRSNEASLRGQIAGLRRRSEMISSM